MSKNNGNFFSFLTRHFKFFILSVNHNVMFLTYNVYTTEIRHGFCNHIKKQLFCIYFLFLDFQRLNHMLNLMLWFKFSWRALIVVSFFDAVLKLKQNLQTLCPCLTV